VLCILDYPNTTGGSTIDSRWNQKYILPLELREMVYYHLYPQEIFISVPNRVKVAEE